jgi:DNA recombination protein RmuC
MARPEDLHLHQARKAVLIPEHLEVAVQVGQYNITSRQKDKQSAILGSLTAFVHHILHIKSRDYYLLIGRKSCYTTAMDTVLYAIIIILLGGFAVLLYLLVDLKRKASSGKSEETMQVMMDWMREMKQDTEATRQNMDKNLTETNKQINERLDKAAQVIGGVMKELGSMSQIGPDIRRLSETLSSSKLRGNFGEEMLENMLSQVLPKGSYAMQYRFKNGETVDAIVKVGETILCIDSKFSLENFRLYKEAQDDKLAGDYQKAFFKDTKKRIDEIHKKYILPTENTFDFALMYVPSQGVYEEIIINNEMAEYSRSKRVIAVGPNSLYTYLQSIVLSLRGQQINKIAQEILRMVGGIKQESDKFSRTLDVLGNHVKNTYNTMGSVTNDFDKLRSKISIAAELQADETEAIKTQSKETNKLIE